MTQARKPRSYTPPKGRPTPKRAERAVAGTQQARRDARLQWAVVALLGVVAVVALVVVFGDSGGSGVTTHGVPVGGHAG